MNTGLRRFLLHLAVGLLAFLLGIASAWALGGLNPFNSSSGTRQYKHKRCGSYRSWNAPPAFEKHHAPAAVMTELVLVSPDAEKARGEFGFLPPLPPLPSKAPQPPSTR